MLCDRHRSTLALLTQTSQCCDQAKTITLRCRLVMSGTARGRLMPQSMVVSLLSTLLSRGPTPISIPGSTYFSSSFFVSHWGRRFVQRQPSILSKQKPYPISLVQTPKTSHLPHHRSSSLPSIPSLTFLFVSAISSLLASNPTLT